MYTTNLNNAGSERENKKTKNRNGNRERELDYRKWIDFIFFKRIGIVVAIHGEKLDPKKMAKTPNLMR